MKSDSTSPTPKPRRSSKTARPSLLTLEDQQLITKARTLDPIKLSNRELARLISVVLHDLGHSKLIPDWVGPIESRYYDLPLDWFTQDGKDEKNGKDAGDGFDFEDFFNRCTGITAFRTIFQCICKLHTRRRKFVWILSQQPIPTMDQVAPRGLLEHGIVGVPGLASWLTWRKWIYDIDNRSAQETGYLFEPILAASLGGEAYSATDSPVKRGGEGGRRQVDCVIDAGGDEMPTAYEFKARMTIAASGQGRFDEELAFPEDCKASGYRPVLLVLDPTPSDKLKALTKAFRNAGGEAYVGEDVWTHVKERSGEEITRFVKAYIRDPILHITKHANELHDLSLAYRPGESDQDAGRLQVTVGSQSWEIRRPSRESVQKAEEVKQAKQARKAEKAAKAGKEEKEGNAGKVRKTKKTKKADGAAEPAQN